MKLTKFVRTTQFVRDHQYSEYPRLELELVRKVRIHGKGDNVTTVQVLRASFAPSAYNEAYEYGKQFLAHTHQCLLTLWVRKGDIAVREVLQNELHDLAPFNRGFNGEVVR